MQYFCELSKEKQAKETHTRNVSQFTTFYYQLHLTTNEHYCIVEVYVLFS